MKTQEVIFCEEIDDVIYTIFRHTNWPIVFGLRRAYLCDFCINEIAAGQETIEINVSCNDSGFVRTEKEFYCCNCLHLK